MSTTEEEENEITYTSAKCTWSIPSCPDITRELLCFGYIHHHYEKYIPPHLIHLLSKFYSNDLYTINHFKNSSWGSRFLSPIYTMHSLKWYIELWPNGCNKTNTGQVRLFVCLCTNECRFKGSIAAICTVSVIETNTVFKQFYEFSKLHWYFNWPTKILQLSDIKNKQTLTITLEIKIANIRTHIYKPLELPTKSFTWAVEDSSIIKQMHNAPNVYGFSSPVFGFCGIKWFITFYPNGSRINRVNEPNMFLNLASIRYSDIEVHIRMTLRFGEYIDENILKYNSNAEGFGHSGGCGDMNELVKCDRFYFQATIKLIDVYYKNNYAQIFDDEVDGKDENEMEVLNPPCREYIWNLVLNNEIPDAMNAIDGYVYQQLFEMYKLRWKVTVNDSGNITLYIAENTFDESWIDIVAVRCYISVIELNVRYVQKAIFHRGRYRKDWGDERVLNVKFKALDECRIKLEMELIDVYFDGNNITDQYV